MTQRRFLLIAAILIAFAAIASLYASAHLPARVPTHWDIHGQVNRYGSRNFVVFFMPMLMVGMTLLAWALPWLSPKQLEIQRQSLAYFAVMAGVLTFMVFIHGVVLASALGHRINVPLVMNVGICALLAII